MITHGDNPRTMTRIGRLTVLGLALLALPLFPTFAEKPAHEKETRAAVEHGAKLLQKLGREKDAKILFDHLHHGGQTKTIAALWRSIELMKKLGNHADAKRLAALAKRLSGKQGRHSKALVAALTRAAKLLEVVEEHGKAKIIWRLLKGGHGKARHGKSESTYKHFEAYAKKLNGALEAGKITKEAHHKAMVSLKKKLAALAKGHGKHKQARSKHKEDADLWAIWKKLQYLVKAGKMTEKEAHAKMGAIKKAYAAGKQPGKQKKADYKMMVLKKEFWEAVEKGILTKQEAARKWAAYLKYRKQGAKKTHGKQSGKYKSKTDAYLEAVGRKLKQAVAAGKMTEEEAKKKYAAIVKKLGTKYKYKK